MKLEIPAGHLACHPLPYHLGETSWAKRLDHCYRVAESQSEQYKPSGKDKAYSPEWSEWRDTDRSVLKMYARIGYLAVCGKECKNRWEQIHRCIDGCACYQSREKKRRQNLKRWKKMSWEEQQVLVDRIEELELDAECYLEIDDYGQKVTFPWDGAYYSVGEETRLERLLAGRRAFLRRKETEIQKGLNAWLAEWDAWANHKYQFPTPLTAEEEFELVSRTNGAPALPTMFDSPFARSIRAKLIRPKQRVTRAEKYSKKKGRVILDTRVNRGRPR